MEEEEGAGGARPRPQCIPWCVGGRWQAEEGRAWRGGRERCLGAACVERGLGHYH